jgi:hypothetical protein
MSMFTTDFWKATAERACSTAAQSALLVVGAGQFDVLTVDWQHVAGFAAGGFVLTVLKCMVAANTGYDNSPSFGSIEELPVTFAPDK